MLDYINYIHVDKSVDELENDFIKEFIRFRKENNLTQEVLGYYSKVPRTKIARIESGMHSPSINSILNIIGPIGYTIRIEKIKNSR